MSRMSGADPDALDRIAVELERSSRQLAASNSRLGRQLHAAPWHGRNAERFRQAWDGEHSRALRDAIRFLDDAGDLLRSEAAQQRDASRAPGSGGGGGGSWLDRDGTEANILAALTLLGLPATFADLGFGSVQAIVTAAAKNLVHVKSYVTASGRQVSAHLRWAPGQASVWRRILGEAKNVTKLSTALHRINTGVIVLGGVLSGISQHRKDAHLGIGERLTRAATVGVGRAAAGWLAAEGGALVGAKVGGLIGSIVPGVGTAVGIAVGAAIGAGIGSLGGGLGANVVMDRVGFDRHIADIGSKVYDRGAEVVDDVMSTGRSVLRAGGGLLSGGANLVKSLGGLW